MDNTIGKLIVQVLMDAEQYDDEVDKVQKKTSLLKDFLDGLANSIEKAFKASAIAIGAAASATAVGATLIGSSFEQAISKVAAVKGIDKVSDDFARLEAEARRLGASTMFTATEAAQGMEELARAGLSTDEIIAASQKTLELAAGSQISLAESAAIVAASMAQFGLSASETGRITDVLTVATQNTLFGMEDLSTAMRYAGTVGAALGMTIEETTAAVAQFRNLGLEGSMAGTNFREAMSSIAKVTPQAEAALARYGLTVRDVNPEVNTFRDIMIKVGKAGLTTGDAMTIFGLRTGANVKKIAEDMARSSDEYDALLGKLEEAAGATATTYEIMTDNVAGAFNEAKSAAEEFLISLFGTYAGPLKDLFASATNLFREMGEEIARRTGYIGATTESAFGKVTAFIDANAKDWARTMGDIVEAVANFANMMATKVLPVLGRILPYVDDLAIAMASFLAAHKITIFVSFVTGQLIPALVSTTWTLKGVAAAMAAATGGMSALAAGVAVLIAGLAVMIGRLSKARQETQRLQKAQENASRRMQEDQKWSTTSIDYNLRIQQQQARETLDQLDREGRLTSAIRERLEWTLALTAAEVYRGIKAGEILQLEEGGYARVSDLLQGSQEDRQLVLDHIEHLQAEMQRLEEAANRRTLSGAGLQEEADARAYAAEKAEAHRQTIDGLRMALQTYQPVQDDATDGADRFAEALARLDRLAEGASGNLDELVKAAQDAADELNALPGQIRDEMADIGATEEEQARLALARRKQAVRDLARVALSDHRLTADERLQIEEDLQLAIELLEEKARQERAAAERKALALQAEMREADALRAAERQASALESLYEEALRARLSEAERLERHYRLSVLPTIEGQSGKEIDEIRRYWLGRIREAREREAAEVEDHYEAIGHYGANAFRRIADAAYTLRRAFAGVMSLGRRVLGLITSITGASLRLSDGMRSVQDAVAGAEEEHGPLSARQERTVAAQAAKDFVGGIVAGAEQFARLLIAAVPVMVDGLARAIPAIVQAFADALPAVVDATVSRIPDVVDALVGAIPRVVDALAESMPQVALALAEQVPRILQAVIDELPRIFGALMDAAVVFVDGIVRALPTLIQSILAAIPKIVDRLILAIPDILTAIMEGLPEIVEALIIGIVEAVPQILVSVIQGVPDIVLALVDGIPEIVVAVVRSIPRIVGELIRAIPDIIAEVVKAVPEIMAAMGTLIPQLTVAVIRELPRIAKALLQELLIELPRRIPAIARQIGKAIVQGLRSVIERIGKLLGGLFRIGGKKNKDKSSASAYGGIPYVPATMRITVHEGEEVRPASGRDPVFAGASEGNPALAGARQGQRGGSPQPVRIDVNIDGATVDSSLITAYQSGKAPGLRTLQRRAVPHGVGIDPGKFNKWGK